MLYRFYNELDIRVLITTILIYTWLLHQSRNVVPDFHHGGFCAVITPVLRLFSRLTFTLVYDVHMTTAWKHY